jgi:uncharacterized protein with HEPN domain
MKEHLVSILESIEDIEFYVSQTNNKIVAALEDRTLKPAIRMKLITIAEQFNRLKNENAFEILSHFDKEELRGMQAVRNFIAHDYDSVDDEILEVVIRKHLPKIKEKVLNLVY